VSTLVPVVGFGENEAVSPEYRGEGLKVTLPTIPATVMVLVAEPPWATVSAVGEALRLNVALPLSPTLCVE
jgi:hypothetical protein